MQLYAVQDLNDSSKIILERRSSPEGTIAPAPEGEDPAWLVVQDVLDPVSNQVIGKKVVIDQELKLSIQTSKNIKDLEHKWEQLRAFRDKKLSLCDWTQMPDVHLSANTIQEWRTYRQQLRDITNNLVDPDLVDWPLEP